MRFLLLLVTTSLLSAAVPKEDAVPIQTLLRERKLGEAEAAANALVSRMPGEAHAHVLLGAVRMNQQKPEAAVASFEKAVELAPADAEIRRQLGDAYGFSAQKAGMLSKLGWARKCRAAYEKAVELDPKNVNARFSLMGFYQMAPAMVGGGMDKAHVQAAEIKKLDAERGTVALTTLYTAEKKFTEAFRELDQALTAKADSYPILFQLGRTAAMSGERLEDGLRALQRCLTLAVPAGSPPYEAAHWRIGNIYEKKGDPAAARAAYDASLAANPSFGQAAAALKKLEEAKGTKGT